MEEWISIIIDSLTLIIGGIGLWVAINQINQVVSSRKQQHEQLRREKTVELVIYYVNSINKDTKSVEKIVATLSDAQCQDLYTETPFCIDEKTRKDLCNVCPQKHFCNRRRTKTPNFCLCKKEDGYIVDGDVLRFLRSTIIDYLNTLESVLLAWQLNIVDRKVIQDQFAFLNKKRHTERALQTFRTVAGGGKSYPAIEMFYQFLDNQNRDEASEKLKDILE